MLIVVKIEGRIESFAGVLRQVFVRILWFESVGLKLREELIDIDAVLSRSERGQEAVTLIWKRLRLDLICVERGLEKVIGEIVQNRESFGHH